MAVGGRQPELVHTGVGWGVGGAGGHLTPPRAGSTSTLACWDLRGAEGARRVGTGRGAVRGEMLCVWWLPACRIPFV